MRVRKSKNARNRERQTEREREWGRGREREKQKLYTRYLFRISNWFENDYQKFDKNYAFINFA